MLDYPDPANFINVLLDGRRIQADNNVNASYFNNPTYNARMDKAYSLAGDARTNAYAILDRDIMKDQAPVARTSPPPRAWLTSTKVGCFQLLRRPGHPADPDLHQVGRGRPEASRTTGGEHSSPRPLPPDTDSITLPTT